MNHTCIRMLYSLPVMSKDATPWKVADVVYHLLKDFAVRQSAFGHLSRNVEKGAGLKQTILKRLELVTSMNYHLLLSKGTWSQGSFQTYSFDFQLSLICQASRSCRVWQERCSGCSGTRLEVARKLVCHWNDFMLTIMRRGLANWIWVFFAIGLPLHKASLPVWAVQLFMWDDGMTLYIEICYASWGVCPSPKFGLFATPSGLTAASFADRLLIYTQRPFAHTPQKQTNNKKRWPDCWDNNQSHALS